MSARVSESTPMATSLFGLSRDRARVVLSLAAVYTIWGSTYLALKWMIEGLPPLAGAGSRYALAGALLLGFVTVRGGALPTARQWLASVPTGALLFTVGNGFISLAEREVSSSVAAIVCATMPLLTAGLGALSGEAISRRDVLGLFAGFVGVAVMTSRELAGASLTASLVLLAPVGWALGTFLARKLPQARGLCGAGAQMVSGGVATFLAGMAHGERWPAGPIPARAIGAFFYLVIAGSLIAFSAYSHLLKTTRPAVATSYAYVNPVIAVMLGVVLGGETITIATAIGGAIVVMAVLFVVRARR